MVYRGRPSTGCLRCRQRKIKCDERAEGCIKCMNRGFVCPGYENQVDRLFQDESEKVKQKVVKSITKAIALRNERFTKDRSGSMVPIRPTSRASYTTVSAPMLTSAEMLGINFFMQHLATGIDQPSMSSEVYYSNISTFGFHPVIAAAMTAIGLASIAGISKDRCLQEEATRLYLKAIKRTNTALASPQEVKNDSTLLAVILLGVFEATTGSSNLDTFIAWAKHIEGTAALAKVRGKEQFATDAGRRLFLQAAAQLMMIYTGREESLPDHVHELLEEVFEYGDAKDPVIRFYKAYMQYSTFRVDIIQGRITDLCDILERALELDETAAEVFAEASPTWNYQVIRNPGNLKGIYGELYHIYPHYLSAQTWNWLRLIRLGHHDIIRTTLLKGFAANPRIFTDPRYSHLLEETIATASQMQSDILASIPQHLHDTPPTYPAASSSATGAQPRFLWSNFSTSALITFPNPGTTTSRLPQVRVSGGYSLLWPLYVAGATGIASPESQTYVMKTLERVAEEMGINQAKVLAGALRLKVYVDGIKAQRGGEEEIEVPPRYMVRWSPQINAKVKD
ncbi:hypothetical protein GQ43DRAFT_423944 [Delitschia confertaspora ATCC 74209]|uniref:Zn(2)-C6 fungal-type domain-containing protein n=1 Tax=Delitschia confertaspora ATCC 74209 TaxID=1513339 RepID=A0A9P4MM05_9PLEO|nr:hypothetical protein GQ43DRAFT_423944 [Delitschia confertaspora ATCC 74209]